MKTHKQINWEAEARRVQILTDSQITAELAGLIDALDAADEMDRATGDDRGGYYRDVCSVLRAEMRRRVDSPVCHYCGK